MSLVSALASLFLLASPASAQEVAFYCTQHQNNPLHHELVQKLATKLSYSYTELCNHPRIDDLFIEDKAVYNRENDTYEDHKFLTIHYNEYSCQYTWNLVTSAWGKQHCYNTF